MLRRVNMSLSIVSVAVHTIIPPSFAHAKMYTALICWNFSILLERLRYCVFTRPAALLDQVSRCAICDIGLGHEWGFLPNLLCDSDNTRRSLGTRLFDRFRSNVCSEAVRSMVQSWGSGGKASLCAAAGYISRLERSTCVCPVSMGTPTLRTAEGDLESAFEQALQT